MFKFLPPPIFISLSWSAILFSPCLLFCHSLSFFSVYLSFFPVILLALSHLLSTSVFIPFCLFNSFSLFLSVYVSFSPACLFFSVLLPLRFFLSLSGRHKSLSCWLLKCEEWQIWWFLTAVAGFPRFTSPHPHAPTHTPFFCITCCTPSRRKKKKRMKTPCSTRVATQDEFCSSSVALSGKGSVFTTLLQVQY